LCLGSKEIKAEVYHTVNNSLQSLAGPGALILLRKRERAGEGKRESGKKVREREREYGVWEGQRERRSLRRRVKEGERQVGGYG
jgi:hypothetical protein